MTAFALSLSYTARHNTPVVFSFPPGLSLLGVLQRLKEMRFFKTGHGGICVSAIKRFKMVSKYKQGSSWAVLETQLL